jgi:hypothetical protein
MADIVMIVVMDVWIIKILASFGSRISDDIHDIMTAYWKLFAALDESQGYLEYDVFILCKQFLLNRNDDWYDIVFQLDLSHIFRRCVQTDISTKWSLITRTNIYLRAIHSQAIDCLRVLLDVVPPDEVDEYLIMDGINRHAYCGSYRVPYKRETIKLLYDVFKDPLSVMVLNLLEY